MPLQLPPDIAATHTLALLDVEVLYYVLMAAVIALWLYFGGSFIARGQAERENKAQRAYWRGFGTFVVLAAAFEVLFVIDMFAEIYYDAPLLNRASDYGIDSINYNDFFVLMPTVMAVCAANLLYPIEGYMYKKERATLTWAYGLLAPIPIVVRIVEVNLEDWLGVEVVTGSLPFFIMTVLWGAMLVLAFATGVIVMAYYQKIARAAPPRATIRRKIREIQAGIVLWATGSITTLWARQELWKFWDPAYPYGVLFPFWTPAFLLVALILLNAGFSRKFSGE